MTTKTIDELVLTINQLQDQIGNMVIPVSQKKYVSTKTYSELTPVAYRQWRADTHCNKTHGPIEMRLVHA